MMGVLTQPIRKTSTCLTSFTCPDLTTFRGLEELGLVAVGERLEPDRAVVACRVSEPDDWCRWCGCQGVARDTLTRRLAHEPFGWRPTTLLVTVRRYRYILDCEEPINEQKTLRKKFRALGCHSAHAACRRQGRLSDGPVRSSRAPGRELPGVRPGPTGRRGGWRWPACAQHRRLGRSWRPLEWCVRASP